MKSVFTQEWVDDDLGHSGHNRRYSIHFNEEDRDAFAREHGKELNYRGRALRPNGRWAVVGVDEDVYEEVRASGTGIWYTGKAYWDGEEFEMGSRSN